ncbi:MAG: hypothetical protein ISS82_02875 [Nanoarchaeota archaeon]|nr:hypothetical protein [Nanoarchaeota archaeon]
MNKKASMEINLGTVFALVIAAFLVIFLIGFMSKNLLFAFQKEDQSLESFTRLIDEINILNNNQEKQILFFRDDPNYIIISFPQTQNSIGGLGKKCNGFSLTEEIEKPFGCEEDKGCLCLCIKLDSKLSKESCEPENKGKCVSFNYDITDNQNACNYFILFEKEDKNLKISKKDNIININKE